MAVLSLVPNIDFTDLSCAYKNDELSLYPDCVRPTVERMRMLSQSRLAILSDQELGSGSYGVVYKGYYENKLGTKFICAIKIFTDPKSYEADCYNEGVALWKSAGVPHVVGFHGFASYQSPDIKKANCLVLDFLEGNSLSNVFASKKFFRTEIVELAKQYFKFLIEYQKPAPNRSGVGVHGDLAPENSFWHGRKLTVIDFGLSRERGFFRDPVVQKAHYRAPEIWLNQKSEASVESNEAVRFTESIDMWSIGVIIYQFVTGRGFLFDQDYFSPYGHHEISILTQRIGMPPATYLERVVATDKFFQKTKENTFVLKPEIASLPVRKSMDETFQVCPHLFPEIKDLLKKILVWDPAERITPEEALKHPLFFRNLKIDF